MEPTCRVEQHATCNHCQAPILSRAANQRLTNQKPSPVSDDWLVSAMSWFCESNSKLSVSPHLPHMWTQTRGVSSRGQMSPCETLPTGSHVPCPQCPLPSVWCPLFSPSQHIHPMAGQARRIWKPENNISQESVPDMCLPWLEPDQDQSCLS